jgi:hypothetical protein
MSKSFRLLRNFHKSFKPERQYINALLRYAASGKSGDYQEIADETGIPMGGSSGKVPAILDYSLGMKLVELVGQTKSAIKKIDLTAFGRSVLLEDPFLKLNVTQWLAHLNLCSPLCGAEVWYQTFFPGKQSLGMVFERSHLEKHLLSVLKVDSERIIGPLVGTYEDDAAFRICGALSEEKRIITRNVAPVSEDFAYAYGAWILQLLQDHFPDNAQVSILELDAVAGCRTIPGWDIDDFQKVLQLIERKGLADVDRHMEPWLIQPTEELETAWQLIYSDII